MKRSSQTAAVNESNSDATVASALERRAPAAKSEAPAGGARFARSRLRFRAELLQERARLQSSSAGESSTNGAEKERPFERRAEAELVRGMCDALKIQPIIARILISRGITNVAEAGAFLSPTLRDHLPDPCTIKNILPAADLILDAVQNKEPITVFSDFDVDGLTSASQLLLFLGEIGAHVSSYVPNRFREGYGLSASAVEKLAHAGTRLLVSVDCGISNCDELALARRLGMKSIVLDHHEPGPKLPPADAVVDPAQEGCPFQEHRLAAAGLVWMMLIVLRRRALERAAEGNGPAAAIPDPKAFLDLAALGTICDMVPLRGVNRLIAYRGIEALKNTTRIGVRALKEISGVTSARFGSGQVSFGLGPRINAAGRLGDAGDVVRLLTTEDSLLAKSVAESIDRLNSKRREIENAVRESCLSLIASEPSACHQPALALYGRDFHAGVIGIAAQRLVEEFHKPAAVMAPGEAMLNGQVQQVVKGSVRSVEGFHVADALSALSSLLVSHGGHAAAGGFTLTFDKLEAFQAAFVEHAGSVLLPEMLQRHVTADVRVKLADVDFDIAVEVGKLAPFGVGNPAPLFVTEGVRVDAVTLIGERHLRIRFSDGTCARNAVAWNLRGHPLLKKDQILTIGYHVELNTYQGLSSIQLNLKEVWD